MREKEKEKHTRRKVRLVSGQNFIIFVVLIVSIFVFISGVKVQKKLERCEAKTKTYRMLIKEEKGRGEYIKNLDTYLSSKSFIEKTAREKFGLVFPDETVFAEDKS